MKKPKSTIRTVLLGFLFLIISLPGLQLLFPVVESAKLLGGVSLAANTNFTITTWMRGDYQKSKEAFINDSIGFRPDMVRLNNQMDYFLFQKFHANGVVMGTHKYLYEDGYLNAYNGADFLGEKKIDTLMRKLRFIQDTLGKMGTQFVFMFGPSKGRFYPEFFPKEFQKPFNPLSNYLVMNRKAEQMGIHVLDINGWFCNMKATAQHPLFSKLGIHWTRYGAAIAADSINHYLSALLHKNVPQISFDGLECTEEKRGENDIETGMNLIWPITQEKLCYSQLGFKNDSPHYQKPSPIFISDSFFWTLINQGIPQNCYHNWEFWNYFNDIWDQNAIEGHGDNRNVAHSDWVQAIRKHDVVFLFFSEGNIKNLDRLFIDAAYSQFGGK